MKYQVLEGAADVKRQWVSSVLNHRGEPRDATVDVKERTYTAAWRNDAQKECIHHDTPETSVLLSSPSSIQNPTGSFLLISRGYLMTL